ncbi:Type V secretory pathway, adhesin AidA [Chromobacterium violaceum]|uniref:Type V secretory pathway, adhesin AidA n=1 Tax=Chromobacterium violaceum TaxID=536 RepID=A0A447T9S7_CHRVL|nr:Type V secretory pathway, adhesin AidA [Chromobacterium violaceum]
MSHPMRPSISSSQSHIASRKQHPGKFTQPDNGPFECQWTTMAHQPNGMIFGRNAQINVGSLVASTLSPSSNSNNDTIQFKGSGSGSITNQGHISAAQGGYVALLGNAVSNQGTIEATAGTVALAGGSEIAVGFADNQLVSIQVNKSTLNNFAENQQLIQADGGQVIMTAGAHDSILAAPSTIAGSSKPAPWKAIMANHLIGRHVRWHDQRGGHAGCVGSRRRRRRPYRHLRAHVKIAPDANISTKASNGSTGSWTIDPQNYTSPPAAAISPARKSAACWAAATSPFPPPRAPSRKRRSERQRRHQLEQCQLADADRGAQRQFQQRRHRHQYRRRHLVGRADANASGTGTVVMNGGSINVSGAAARSISITTRQYSERLPLSAMSPSAAAANSRHTC